MLQLETLHLILRLERTTKVQQYSICEQDRQCVHNVILCDHSCSGKAVKYYTCSDCLCNKNQQDALYCTILHPVGSYCANISRCTVHKTLNILIVYV